MTDPAEGAAHHDHRKAYYAVFGALIVGTILTVAATYVQVGRVGNIGLAVAIACVKAGLVGCIFMHLKSDDRAFAAIALLPLILFMVLVLLLLPDVGLAEASPLDDPASQLYKAPAVHH